jgi:hypothetical protein
MPPPQLSPPTEVGFLFHKINTMNTENMTPIRISLPNQTPRIVRKELVPDARAIAIVPIRAFKDRRLTAGLFRALGVCCSYANRAGLLWAGLRKMGEDLGMSGSGFHKHMKRLEALGYIETVHKGFKGERGDTRRIIYNPDKSASRVVKETGDRAPFHHQQEQQKMNQVNKQRAKTAKKQQQNTVESVEVDESSMQIAHDVMQLKNKVSAKIWQLAIQRAGTDNDYDKLKQAIDKLLR